MLKLKVVLAVALARLALAAATDIQPFIISGSDTTHQAIPYQAQIYTTQLSTQYFCGAVIIDSKHILTAGHCDIFPKILPCFPNQLLNQVIIPEIRVVVGKNCANVNLLTDGLLVSAITRHPKYNSTTLDYDMTIVELCWPLTFSSTVQPIALPTQGPPPPGTNCYVSGCGVINSDTDALATQLQVAQVQLVSQQFCQAAYPTELITDRMICALGQGTATCDGDSGGPLVCNGILTGTVSFGPTGECYQNGLPGGYANIYSFLDFINLAIKYRNPC